MTAWKCAVIVLSSALMLFGAAPASPGQAAYEKANRLLVAQKLPEALAAVDEALRLDPKLVPALTLKAKLAMAAYRLDIAHQCLQQALALDPRAPYAQFLGSLRVDYSVVRRNREQLNRWFPKSNMAYLPYSLYPA